MTGYTLCDEKLEFHELGERVMLNNKYIHVQNFNVFAKIKCFCND